MSDVRPTQDFNKATGNEQWAMTYSDNPALFDQAAAERQAYLAEIRENLPGQFLADLRDKIKQDWQQAAAGTPPNEVSPALQQAQKEGWVTKASDFEGYDPNVDPRLEKNDSPALSEQECLEVKKTNSHIICKPAAVAAVRG